MAHKVKVTLYRYSHRTIQITLAYIANDCQLGEAFQYTEPYADVLTSFGNWSSGLTDELVGVETYLHPVVEQREEWSQREGGDKDRNEPEL